VAEKIAAYHEAGHVVCAVASRYHNLVMPITVENAYGEAPISLSKSKVRAGGKPTEVEASLADPEIATDAAIVFLAGFAAEVRYCQIVVDGGGKAKPDRSLSNNDYEAVAFVLGKANVKTPLAELEAAAAEHVAQLWPIITDFAEELHRRRGFDPVDAIDFIQARLGRWYLISAPT
jgi:hypothetical protein